jgi:hypothetical protein
LVGKLFSLLWRLVTGESRNCGGDWKEEKKQYEDFALKRAATKGRVQ